MVHKRGVKWIIIILIAITSITALRLIWHYYLTTLEYKDKPQIVQGVLDLRDFEYSQTKTLRLDGEWLFLQTENLEDQQTTIQVPGITGEMANKDSHAYGAYHLRILVDEEVKLDFAIRIQEIKSAFAVYSNGKLVSQPVSPTGEWANYNVLQTPSTSRLTPEQGQIDLVIHVANRAGGGGITKAIRFGTVQAIDKRVNLSLGLQLFLCVVFIIHCVYAMILWLFNIRNRGAFYFLLIMFFGLLSVLISDDKLLFAWSNIDYVWGTKLVYFTYISVVTLMPMLLQYLFPKYLPNKVLYSFGVFVLMYLTFVIIAPVHIVQLMSKLLTIVMVASVALSTYTMWKAIRDKQNVVFLLLASLFIGVNIIWASIQHTFILELMTYPFDIIFAIFAFSTFWFKNYYNAMEKKAQLADRLQAEEKQKDEFLVNTAHELRNPLHGMINLTEVVLRDKSQPLSKKQEEHLTLLSYMSKHLSLLVTDLLDVTRLKEKTLELNWQAVSVTAIVTGINDLLEISFGDKPIKIQNKIAEDFPALWGDEQRIVQILFNLLHNAVKYTEEGTIIVSAKVVNGWAEIYVEDTGAGIAEKDVSKIFAPYEQGANRMLTGSGGLGQGLNISKELVELHGGTIAVQSVINEGTTVTFTIPITAVTTHNNHVEEVVTYSLKEVSPFNMQSVVAETSSTIDYWTNESDTISKIKILVVDDDPVNLKILRNILEAEHYEVIAVSSPKKALALLEETIVDLVISDVMMPNISGYELTSRIRARYSLVELPVLLLTARVRTEDIVTGFQVGANDYLIKPLETWELKVRVRTLTKIKVALDEHVRMEGAWLQSQIQPHFLFNTLNSIAALGVTDPEKMLELLGEFSNYLRLSFDFKNADPVVPIMNELELVRSYTYIEQSRFGDRLNVEWEVDQNLELEIPPLSIQPLVENAINHGVLTRLSGGTVRIKIQEMEKSYKITVCDNGKGMSKVKLALLFDRQIGEDYTKRTSVGLPNINRRLKQLYDQSLTIKSKVDEGTMVSFCIPKK